MNDERQRIEGSKIPDATTENLRELAKAYQMRGGDELAAESIDRLILETTDPEKKAFLFLTRGQQGEARGDFASAASFYTRGLELEPNEREVAYLLLNNLGCSLNELGEYIFAGVVLLEAIELEPTWFNAFKNLGVQQEKVGRPEPAAKLFVRATLKCPSDGHALGLLEALVAKHPGLALKFQTDLVDCRNAVRNAQGYAN